jgi:anti-sigma B factor antagonist
MTSGRSVIVKQLPAVLDTRVSQAFFLDVQQYLATDRPCLVFDLSEVRQLDSSGVDLLLCCVEEAMKRNGDVKLAAVSRETAIVLEMTRIDRLFEIFDSCSDAVESFHRFSPRSLRAAASRGLEMSMDADQQRES